MVWSSTGWWLTRLPWSTEPRLTGLPKRIFPKRSSFITSKPRTTHHDVVLANGAATETFVDAAGRAGFDNHQEYLDLYGAERIIPEMNTPRISTQRLLPDAIKARLGIVDQSIEFNQLLHA
ncbi:MAG: hypothetical protein ACI9PY_000581 [Ascidiaceihabitans sp.]|jgi:hypothetical protein